MALKIETQLLNDSNPEREDASVEPSEREICDDVVLLWREEPITEEFNVVLLHQRILERNPDWRLSCKELERVLRDNNLFEYEESKLYQYSDQVIIPDGVTAADSILDMMLNGTHHHKKHSGSAIPAVKIVKESDGRRGLVARHDIEQDQLILEEKSPIIQIAPLDKLRLMRLDKCCCLCGRSLNSISTHTIVLDGLDCNGCNMVWCSKSCKKSDLLHPYVRHLRSKNREINNAKWFYFEQHCAENQLIAAYAVALWLGYIILESTDPRAHNESEQQDENIAGVEAKLNALAKVSQRVRAKFSDSLNLGGTLDASAGYVAVSDNIETVWTRTYDLFLDVFPNASERINLDMFLQLWGCYNINQISGQVYLLSSIFNHSCEPNVRYEIDEKTKGIKLYARKPIRKDEELFITYINPLHEVRLRKRELRVNYGFLCSCERCERESEATSITSKTSPTESRVNINIKDHDVHSSTVTDDEETDGESDISDSMKLKLNIKELGSMDRRRSSMKTARPDLDEIMKNGQNFDTLSVAGSIGGRRRRTSVRFEGVVSVAIEER